MTQTLHGRNCITAVDHENLGSQVVPLYLNALICGTTARQILTRQINPDHFYNNERLDLYLARA
jgi:hypothetical protein